MVKHYRIKGNDMEECQNCGSTNCIDDGYCKLCGTKQEATFSYEDNSKICPFRLNQPCVEGKCALWMDDCCAIAEIARAILLQNC